MTYESPSKADATRKSRGRKGQSTGKNEPIELRAYARGWWLEQPQSGSNCLEIENCLDFPSEMQEHSFARSGNNARGIDLQAAPEKGCRLKRTTENCCRGRRGESCIRPIFAVPLLGRSQGSPLHQGPMSYGLIERGERRVLLHPARLGCGGHVAPSAAFTTNSGTSGQSSSAFSVFFTSLVTAQRASQLSDSAPVYVSAEL